MKTKKQFGQHFLRDARVIQKIISAAEITPGEYVIEIGPGQGVLTEALLTAGAKVTAVEIDHDLIPILQEKFGDRITLISADFLSLPLPRYLLPSYKLISNLPYNVASAILEKLFTTPPHPTRLVVMVQREVGERILAKPPESRFLSIACQIYADVKKVTLVPPGAFAPPPKVDSIVLRMDWNPKVEDPEAILSFVKAGFAHPRKQLAGSLRADGRSKEDTVAFLTAHGLPATARPEELSLNQWIELAKK